MQVLKTQFTEEQIKIARRLTLGAAVYQNHHLQESVFKDQFKDEYKALICFVEHYAYERQGAARAYPIIARMAIEKMFRGKLMPLTRMHAKNAWEICKEIARKDFNNIKLNESHNPMKADKGILATMTTHKISNLSLYVKELIQQDKTAKAHSFIASVRGVGSKIAPFYLRDIAYLGNLEENKIKDPHYLQPIDTWLIQTLSIILGDEVPRKLEEKQKIIVELCEVAGCSPIAFNQGAWVLGSQIAGSFKMFREIAVGENARSILEEHVSTMKQYVAEVERIVDRFE